MNLFNSGNRSEQKKSINIELKKEKKRFLLWLFCKTLNNCQQASRKTCLLDVKEKTPLIKNYKVKIKDMKRVLKTSGVYRDCRKK